MHTISRRTTLKRLAVAASLGAAPSLALSQAGTVIRVGPNQTLKKPSDAARVARDGAIVEIESAIYNGDVAYWPQNNLTLRSYNGRVRMPAAGQNYGGKGIWVIGGSNVTVQGIDFLAAKVPDQNGAGIRFEGINLNVLDCSFSDCENGILSGDKAGSEILIDGSKFQRCGFGDGRSHGLYIGTHDLLTVRACQFRDTKIGHHLKTRALKSRIEYSYFVDTATIASSYAIDASNGGDVVLLGNLIQESANSENTAAVAFGMEGFRPGARLTAMFNTMINGAAQPRVFIKTHTGADALIVVNNVLVNFTPPYLGLDPVPAAITKQVESNFVASASMFADPSRFDYRFKAGSAPRGQVLAITDPTLIPRHEPLPQPRTVTLTGMPTLPGAFQSVV